MRLATMMLGLAAVVMLAGCGSESEEDGGAAADEPAFTEAQVPELAKVEAIKFAAGAGLEAQQIASPVKRKAIFGAMKKQNAGIVGLCAPTNIVNFELFDAAGKKIGTGSHRCGRGNLTFGTKVIDTSVDAAKIKEQRALPLTPSDVLFGIDEIKITKKGDRAVSIKDAKGLADVKAAMELETTKPGVVNPSSICTTVDYLEKGTEVGTSAFACPTSGPAKIDASFSVLHGPAGIPTITAVEGLIKVDHKQIAKIAKDHE